jgi:hypothetical protein
MSCLTAFFVFITGITARITILEREDDVNSKQQKAGRGQTKQGKAYKD